MPADVGRDLADQPDVVGAEREPPDRPLPREDQQREPPVGLVDHLVRAEHELARLTVRALDQPDRRVQRHQRVDVTRGALQVGLEADARVRMLGPELAVQVERPVDVRGRLHVEPQPVPVLGRRGRELPEVRERGLRILVEPQVARLDRELGVETFRGNTVVGFSVLLDDPPGVGELRHVLAERGEHRREPSLLQALRGADRVLEGLPRHEATHAPAYEAELRKVLAEPAVLGRPQHGVTSHVHVGSLTNRVGRPGRRRERTVEGDLLALAPQPDCPRSRRGHRCSWAPDLDDIPGGRTVVPREPLALAAIRGWRRCYR